MKLLLFFLLLYCNLSIGFLAITLTYFSPVVVDLGIEICIFNLLVYLSDAGTKDVARFKGREFYLY